MLSSKQIVFLALFIILFSVVGYFVSSTSPNRSQVRVQLLWQENVLDCQASFEAGKASKTWLIEQLQFFISDIQIGSKKSGWQKVNLVASPYQANDTVLLGTNCRENQPLLNQAHTGNWHIDFEPNVNMSKSSRMRFTLGVPFTVNHLNPISQASPLNLPSMFWVWQTGHKFMRLELASDNEQWLFHLGSTGCSSASVMRAPAKPCLYPNSANFELPITVADDDSIMLNLDLAALLNNVELTAASSCQSQRDSASCQQLFANLAIANDSTALQYTSGVFNSGKAKHTNKGITVD